MPKILGTFSPTTEFQEYVKAVGRLRMFHDKVILDIIENKETGLDPANPLPQQAAIAFLMDCFEYMAPGQRKKLHQEARNAGMNILQYFIQKYISSVLDGVIPEPCFTEFLWDDTIF